MDEADLRGLDQMILLIESCGWDVSRESGARLRLLFTEYVSTRTTLGAVRQWTREYGASLSPASGSADTYGDGMRAAKDQVCAMLTRGGE